MSSDSTEESDEKPPRHDSQLDGADYSLSNGKTISSDGSSKQDNAASRSSNGLKPGAQRPTAVKHSNTSWFTIPAPLKRVFDKFPLVTYSENELPIRVRRRRAGNILYIFAHETDASAGRPSFNPSCLKWQTYLKISGISFKTLSSNNHASPSGSLPFLLTNAEGSKMSEIIPSSRLKRWIKETAPHPIREASDVRAEVYTSLLENCIRKAWLYQLYLHPANEAVVKRLYVAPASSNPLVQLTILSQLRSAAESEIVKASASSGTKHIIEESEIIRDAKDAFEALSTVLGDGTWFFSGTSTQEGQASDNGSGPSLFDASVFAYTHLILDDNTETNGGVMRWNENGLKTILERYENLVRHRQRILEMYY